MDLYTVTLVDGMPITGLTWIEALSLVEAQFRTGANEIHVRMERQA